MFRQLSSRSGNGKRGTRRRRRMPMELQNRRTRVRFPPVAGRRSSSGQDRRQTFHHLRRWRRWTNSTPTGDIAFRRVVHECRQELHLLTVEVAGSSPARPAMWGGSSAGRARKNVPSLSSCPTRFWFQTVNAVGTTLVPPKGVGFNSHCRKAERSGNFVTALFSASAVLRAEAGGCRPDYSQASGLDLVAGFCAQHRYNTRNTK